MGKREYITLAIIFIIGAAVSPFVGLFDFEVFFHPALVELAHGRNPYTIEGVYTPPWGLLVLAPLGWLPYPIAAAVFFGLMLAGVMAVPIALRLPMWGTLVYVLSLPVLMLLWYGNIDWMVVGGLALPPPLNILALTLKPQVGIGLLVYVLITDRRGPLYLAGLFALGALSLLAFGDWMTPWLLAPAHHLATGMNVSLFPYSLLVGIPILALALRYRRPAWALAAGPLLAPYALMYSYTGIILVIVDTINRRTHHA